MKEMNVVMKYTIIHGIRSENCTWKIVKKEYYKIKLFIKIKKNYLKEKSTRLRNLSNKSSFPNIHKIP